MSTETTNKKIKIDNGTTFGRTYTDKAIDERLQGLVSTATFTPVKEKANNSLQKPAGLTKTKLVGVGTNGQENIEIGDNLTLANGKLSASVSGNSATYYQISQNNSSWVGDNKAFSKYNIVCLLTAHSKLYPLCSNSTGAYYLEFENNETKISIKRYIAKPYGLLANNNFVLQLQTYSHFITLTNNTSTFYLTYQNTSGDKLNTLDSLKTALVGKYLLCTGHTDSDTAEYISGEGGNVIVGVVDNSDKSTSGITIDTSFTISDDVSPVE